MSPLGHLLKLVLYYAPYFSSMEICTMPAASVCILVALYKCQHSNLNSIASKVKDIQLN